MSIDNVTYFTMTPVELLLYENRMRIGSEVQEILELFQMLYNLHFSKDLSDCIIKPVVPLLISIWAPLLYIKLSRCNLHPLYTVLLRLNQYIWWRPRWSKL